MAKGSCFGHKPHFTSIPSLCSFYLLESWYENTFIFFFPRRKWPFWLCCVHFHFQTRRRLHTSPLIPQPHFSPQGSLLFQEIQFQLQVPGRWRQEGQKNPLTLFYKCNFYTYIFCVCVCLSVNMPCLTHGEDSLCELVLSLPSGIQGMYMWRYFLLLYHLYSLVFVWSWWIIPLIHS